MKTIHTLVQDIEEVITGKGGWDAAINEAFKETLGETLSSRFNPEEDGRPAGTLRMSSIGQPCARRFWYDCVSPHAANEISPSLRFLFLYGDILEDLMLSLAVAAGHTVEGHQDELSILGIKGHRDAVIDGVTVDVKSASKMSFEKFKNHLDESSDTFGYLTQLASYVYAAEDDPKVTDKDGGAFLVVNKVDGSICLDYHNFRETGELDQIEKTYQSRIDISTQSSPPPRGFEPQPEGKSGNLALTSPCVFCDYKKLCHPGLRTFQYKRGAYTRDVHLTKVVREPNVPEVK